MKEEELEWMMKDSLLLFVDKEVFVWRKGLGLGTLRFVEVFTPVVGVF